MDGKPDYSATRNADAYMVVRWLAFILANGQVYGLNHKITQESIRDAAKVLALYHQRHGEFELAVVDDDFRVDGASVGPPIPSTIALAHCLTSLNAPGLCFREGITAQELATFAEMLFLKEEQVQQANGLSGLLDAAGLTSIRTIGFSYQRVAEHETVVAKDGKDEEPATGRRPSGAFWTPTPPQPPRRRMRLPCTRPISTMPRHSRISPGSPRPRRWTTPSHPRLWRSRPLSACSG